MGESNIGFLDNRKNVRFVIKLHFQNFNFQPLLC